MQVIETWSYDVGEGRAYIDNLMGGEVGLHVKTGLFGETWGAVILWVKIRLEKDLYKGRKDWDQAIGTCLHCSMPSEDLAVLTD